MIVGRLSLSGKCLHINTLLLEFFLPPVAVSSGRIPVSIISDLVMSCLLPHCDFSCHEVWYISTEELETPYELCLIENPQAKKFKKNSKK